MVKSNPLRDKLEDDTLDLSLSQLEDVPVKDIALLPKGTTLDLSNNLLTLLPDNFVTLNHLIKLDLSKNQLQELPEYFGHLKSLKHLDLYSNQLERLPVSFCQLKNLRWLDLKGNPLVPALKKAAGECVSAQDCQQCARNVVALMASMQAQMERERQKVLMAEMAKRQEEDVARERERLEKKAAKERRREEAKVREQEKRRRHNMDISATGSAKHEMEQHRPSNATNGRNAGKSGAKAASRGWCAGLLLFMLGLSFVVVATGISLLWIYTGGQLDAKSIDRALPIIRRDVDKTILSVGTQVEYYLGEASMTLGPYVAEAGKQLQAGWVELQRRTDMVAIWVNYNLGPYFCSMKKSAVEYFHLAQVKAAEGWAWIRPQAYQMWLQARPHFEALGAMVVTYVNLAVEWLQKNGPVYAQLAYDSCAQGVKFVAQTVDGLING